MLRRGCYAHSRLPAGAAGPGLGSGQGQRAAHVHVQVGRQVHDLGGVGLPQRRQHHRRGPSRRARQLAACRGLRARSALGPVWLTCLSCTKLHSSVRPSADIALMLLTHARKPLAGKSTHPPAMRACGAAGCCQSSLRPFQRMLPAPCSVLAGQTLCVWPVAWSASLHAEHASLCMLRTQAYEVVARHARARRARARRVYAHVAYTRTRDRRRPAAQTPQ